MRDGHTTHILDHVQLLVATTSRPPRHRCSRWLRIVPLHAGAGTIDSRWFKEDRKLPKEEVAGAKEESRKALMNSTLLVRRLTAILEDEIERTHTSEEAYEETGWERRVLAAVARRKAFKEIIKLLPRKED